MLSMGFIEDIEEILSTIPAEHQTRSFRPPFRQDRRRCKKFHELPKSISIKSEHLTVDAVDHRYYLVNKRDEKLAVLTGFLRWKISPARLSL